MNRTKRDTTRNKVVGIQFSIPSPEEIISGSVTEITSRETYNGKFPAVGGLFDIRMGVIDSGLICPTDGLNYMQTPGYFGHIVLARPVFYVQFVATLLKVLKCTCYRCGRLLLNKRKNQQVLLLSGIERWKYVVSRIATIAPKRCGDDNDDGCGCVQPKLRKDGICEIIAEWKQKEGAGVEDIRLKLTAEKVLTICKRIRDEDISFMGLSPIYSRPEWMICQVMAVPPPSVRPSVKYDAQQRSEDDISHSLINIVKFNKLLKEKMAANSPAHVIDAWTSVLQYYIATLIENKVQGSGGIVAQRSGRVLKSIKERMNGKTGRMRGNLMAKRVNFSARSVITADPNISVRELGVPLKIAKNITKPVTVNKRNLAYLTRLVLAGPDTYPGAKILERKNGMPISLRYANRTTLTVNLGDIVHRHMIDGDAVLFNRQPSLHRMSMMAHIARVMHIGDTFRMNVADTKPYNADFDGDEMNLHMPQDVESEVELLHLAAVPHQIISPADNKPIISVFQDSILGCYLFTEEEIFFSAREAMNLLMMFPHVDTQALFEHSKSKISNYAILSQIFPPITFQLKSETTVVNVKNGKYIHGKLEKDAVGKGTSGILHRICNDFGNMRCATFVDDLQNIVTLFLQKKAFSVGISDLVSNVNTRDSIAEILRMKKQEVKNIIDENLLGIFENKTGKTNEEEFEIMVNNTLNKALTSAEKECFQSLSQDNRFITMVHAGSKGQKLNISQMVSCLGQQNVDNKRIPYGFDSRTLPHFHKFDDSPLPRGFVENSYITGLNPHETFFHAMAGRVGIIDTAVKTAVTGYIQRRLIKGLEDIMVSYDMTLRNSKSKIIQFRYGDDGIDPMKTETQPFPLVEMSIRQIYEHFLFTERNTELTMRAVLSTKAFAKFSTSETMEGEFFVKTRAYVDEMVKQRNEIVTHVFRNTSNSMIHIPVAFRALIRTVKEQFHIQHNSVTDVTPLEALCMIEYTFERLVKIRACPPTLLFRLAYFFHLSPKQILFVNRYNRIALTTLLERITLAYKQAIVNPGEMVGLIAAQSIGGPITQMTLNTFHYAGISSKTNVTRGVPRIDEILSLTDNTKNPSLTIFLNPEHETDREKVESVISRIEYTRFGDIVSSVNIHFDPTMESVIEEDRPMIRKFTNFEKMVQRCGATRDETALSQQSKWVVRVVLDPEILLEKDITVDDVHFSIQEAYRGQVSTIFADFNDSQLVFRIRIQKLKMETSLKKKSRIGTSAGMHPADQADEIFLLKNFQDNLLQNVIIRGVRKISKVVLRNIKDNVRENDDQGIIEKKEIWVLDTVGSNLLDILGLDFIDSSRTTTNDIMETFHVLGIEACRQIIYNELHEVIEFDKSSLNPHHIATLCDRMCHAKKPIAQSRHGILIDDIGVISKGSFETTPDVFLKAAIHAEVDNMTGVSANAMCGQEGLYGTGAFKVLLQPSSSRAKAVHMNDNDVIFTESHTSESLKPPIAHVPKESLGPAPSKRAKVFSLDF